MPSNTFSLRIAFFLSLAAGLITVRADLDPNHLPNQSQQGQQGTNICTADSQTAECQTAWVNSLDDFCLWGPPTPNQEIGVSERYEVAWCTKAGHGARLIPEGAITGAHAVITPDYMQITGTGDLTKLNIAANDGGGELDPHGADGNGNPIGGLVFSTAFGGVSQIYEWTNFMSANEFCIRICKQGGNSANLCNHIYDVMGCAWNMPGNYAAGSFDTCQANTGEPMGIYGGSTFHQGEGFTPEPHPAPASSNCKNIPNLGVAATLVAPVVNSTSSVASSSSSAASTVSSGSASATRSVAVSTVTGSPTTVSAGAASAGPSASSSAITGAGYRLSIGSGAFAGIAALAFVALA